MTKIIFFVTNFYPYLGGLENYLLQLATRLVKRGIKVDVLTYNVNNNDEHEEHDGVGIYRIPCYDIMKDVYSLPRFNKDTKRILKKLAANNYDYVITQTRFFSSSWLGMRFARKNNIRFVHTEHGNVHVKHPNKLIELLAWLYDMIVGKKIFRTAEKVIGISKPCCDFAVKMGADPAKVHLIYNSIDTDKWVPVKEDEKKTLRREFGIRDDAFIISYYGRLIHAKGLQDLINAVKGIDNVKLLLIGAGPYKDELSALAKMHGVDVFMPGVKPPEYILKVVKLSDVSANPSYSEGLPTSVIEGCSCSVPVVATDVGGTSEIIEDGVNGFLIKPKDISSLRKSILKLKEDKLLRNMFGKRAREKVVNNFDWERNVDKYVREILT